MGTNSTSVVIRDRIRNVSNEYINPATYEGQQEIIAALGGGGGGGTIGGGANWVGKSGDTNWANESDIKDGRYIYSFRGGATGVLDRFDIAGGTAGAGAWLNIAYVGLAETFTTGSSYEVSGRYIYIRKDATNRYFKFSIRGHYVEPLTTNLYPDGAALLGDKLFVKAYNDGTSDKLFWLYSIRNTGAELHRLLLYP